MAANDAHSTDPFIHNRKLLETRRFVVLPSLGPLFPGHVMVVSKAHDYSLASMGAEAIAEYDMVRARLSSGPFLSDGIPLEAEHGSTASEKAGACVVHTHVHWIPGAGRLFDEVTARLPEKIAGTLSEIEDVTVPYVYLRANASQGIFAGHGLPSQTVRRILCDILGRDDTDWTQSPRLDWVEQTVSAWPIELP